MKTCNTSCNGLVTPTCNTLCPVWQNRKESLVLQVITLGVYKYKNK